MMKYFTTFSRAAGIAIALLLSGAVAAAEPGPPTAAASSPLPESPCQGTDAVCQAFVEGETHPLPGIPPAVWREARCLSIMAFHEARGEGPLGMKAVIWVAINRAIAEDALPCRIIVAPGQFAPATRHHLRHAARSGEMPTPTRLAANAVADAEALSWARGLAWRTLIGDLTMDPTQGATFFHSRYVRPDWARRYHLTAQIGIHRFYRVPDPT